MLNRLLHHPASQNLTKRQISLQKPFPWRFSGADRELRQVAHWIDPQFTVGLLRSTVSKPL
jgi:hypothetical protein